MEQIQCLKIVKLLLEKNPELININGSGKKSPLHFAVINNCPKIVEYLVKKGAKINQSDKYFETLKDEDDTQLQEAIRQLKESFQ